MNSNIRTCTQKDIRILAEIIRTSFKNVAERFGLTQKNAPRHPSNCKENWIRKDLGRGVSYYIIENEKTPVGCVALEPVNPELYYLERLAVLPHCRRHGFGKALVDHVLSNAKLLGAHRVSIGIISEQTELKNWYKGLGFVEGKSEKFPHLPFRVTFMSYELH